MRSWILVALSCGAMMASAQSMSEVGAAVAGSSIGSAAGKSVSDGITSIFGKVSDQTKKAASTKAAPATGVVIGRGVPAAEPVVPPPPPLKGSVSQRRAPVKWQGPTQPAPEPAPVAEAPKSLETPKMTAEELAGITQGTTRADLLRLGTPSSRITMFDDGHLVELYRYAGTQGALGTVRLSDGAVSSVRVLNQ